MYVRGMRRVGLRFDVGTVLFCLSGRARGFGSKVVSSRLFLLHTGVSQLLYDSDLCDYLAVWKTCMRWNKASPQPC